jgi:thioredoxin-related protein
MKKYQYFLGAMILGVVLMSFISTPTSTTSSEGGIHWMTIEEAMAASAKEPRKIMIDVYTKWCGPCKMMSQNTFTDSSVVDYMNKNYYCVKFDAESADSVVFQGKTYKNPGYDPTKTGRNAVHEFSRYLQVSAYPTLIFMDEKGGYIGPVVGYKTPADLELFVKFFAANMHLTVQTQEQWNAYVQGFKATWKK